ncbi:MAG: O-antigen ligase family protein [Labilithrix sp.]|nr:O-antigen ligase family protein [Labilithrix sp.]MCW5811283.1 O-antigen ligase family protein [Labilithrix sp.]
MFSFAPILLEVLFVLLKPQELYEELLAFKPLYTLPALIGVGFMFDALMQDTSRRVGRMGAAPFAKFAGFFFAWSMLTILIKQPSDVVTQAVMFSTPMIMSFAIAHSIKTWRAFEMLGAFMLALSLFLSFVGTHQASAPFKCHWIDPIDRTILHYDGKPCSGPEGEIECYDGDEENDHGRNYVCEHAGLMNTASVSGRIRFRGNLEDPNELSLTVGIGFPFMAGFFMRKRSVVRLLLMLASFALVTSCVLYSQSRGGQLVLVVVLGVFFCLKFGWKAGAIAGGVVGVPGMAALAALGGRSGQEADESALERVECLQVGIDLIKGSPIIGVGKGQFGEYHFLTAHNSYVLAAAETGLVGFAIWSFVLYLAVKIPLSALKYLKTQKGAAAERARAWSSAMLASVAGLVVGSFFLSFSFHPILWIYVGFSGALCGCVKRDFPDFKVRFRQNEMFGIVFANLTLLFLILVYVRIKLR